jgi:hypothetical protein
VGYLRHIVLFPIKSDVTDEQMTAAVDVLRALADVPGVVEWRVEVSNDARKGRVVVENGLLEADSLERFRTSEPHQHAGELMKELAEVWLIGDYDE